MNTGLPTASFRLCNLLSSPFQFMTPVYQRSYSWTVREAGQLLEDLMIAAGVDAASAAEPDYFLSSIVLLNASDGRDGAQKKPGDRRYDIVDGQQRLITLTLLAAALRALEPDPRSKLAIRLEGMIFGEGAASSGKIPRLMLQGHERSCFEHLIQPGNGDGRDYARDNTVRVSEANLLAVWEHFSAELSQLEEDERRKLATYVCDNCHLVVIFTRDIDRAHRMFSVLNERGRKLQRNDILKAEVLCRVDPAREPQAALQWNLAGDFLGGDFEQFFSHIRTLHGKQKMQVVAGVRSIMEEVGGAERFLERELVPLAKAFHLVLKASSGQTLALDADMRRTLTYLNRLSGQEWVPAALLTMKMYHREAHLPIARNILAEIDRFAHLLRILCLGNAKRISRFNAVIDHIKSGAAEEPDGAAFRLSREEVKSVAFHLRDLHRRSAPVCKLILLRLNDELSGRFHPVDPSSVTVEHVLPTRPAAASEWRGWIPSPEDRAACSESLGNFVLISSRQNDRARNQDFARKQKIYGTPDAGGAILPITAEAVAAKSWRADEIRRREVRFLKLLAKMWRLEIETPPEPQEARAGRGVRAFFR